MWIDSADIDPVKLFQKDPTNLQSVVPDESLSLKSFPDGIDVKLTL